MPIDEAARIEALKNYSILDTLPEPGFDDLVRLASRLCETPMAVVSLVDSDRQWFKARVGVEDTETPREISFCAHGIVHESDLFVVPDAWEDERFAQSPLVREKPHIRFYAGVRLVNDSGHALGMLCVMDRAARQLTPFQEETLRTLGRQAMAQLDLRRELATHKKSREILDASQRELRSSAERYANMVNSLKEVVFQTDAAGLWTFLNPAWEEITGFSAAGSLGKSFLDYVHPDDRERNQALFEPMVQRKKDYCRHEVRYLTQTGGFRWIEVFARLTLDERGEIVGTCGTLHDITQRKLAEDRLRESELLYQSLVEHLPLYITRKDTQGRFTFGNRRLLSALGQTSEQLLGKTDYDFLPPEAAAKLDLNAQLVLSSGESLESIEEIPHRDGTTGYHQMTTIPLRDAEGKLSGVQGFSLDVSERYRMERALRDSEERLKLVIEGSNDGFWDWNVATGEVHFSPRWVEMLGYRVGEIEPCYQSWERLVHPEDLPQVLATLNAHIEGALPLYEVEKRMLTKAGGWKWILARGKVTQRDAAGRPLRATGTHTDISARKQAEQEQARLIRERDALLHRLELVLDRMPIACVIADFDFKITHFNPAAERTFGFSVDDVRGKQPKEMIFPPSEWPVMSEFMQRMALGELDAKNVLRNLTKDGRIILCEWHNTPLLDESGSMIGYLGMAIEITERVRAQDSLRNSLEEKELLLKEVHHRVKNNMQVISSLLNLQSNCTNDTQVRTLFADSQHRINSMALIHEKLYQSRDLARIDFGQYLRELVENLGAVHEETAREVSVQVKADDLQLGIDTAIPCGLIVNELVSNAFKHGFPTGGRGSVFVNMRRDGDMLRLSVRDTGRGLPEQVNFNHANSLGMKLVFTLVRQLRGQIDWESNGGTTFNLLLTEARSSSARQSVTDRLTRSLP